MLLRADTSGSTAVKFELSGGAKRFSGMLFSLAKPDQGCPESGLSFSIEVDDAKVIECAVPVTAKALALDINLAGKQSLTLLIKGDRGGAGCSWICIENPRLE